MYCSAESVERKKAAQEEGRPENPGVVGGLHRLTYSNTTQMQCLRTASWAGHITPVGANARETLLDWQLQYASSLGLHTAMRASGGLTFPFMRSLVLSCAANLVGSSFHVVLKPSAHPL